jgi:hypothetical protein
MSGERFECARGGLGEGPDRCGGITAVVAVAGRGGEDCFLFIVFPVDSSESPEQRAESGPRALPRRDGHDDGLGRSRDTCALVAVAGRGGEKLRYRRSSALRVASGPRAPWVVLVRVWAALGGLRARGGRWTRMRGAFFPIMSTPSLVRERDARRHRCCCRAS